MELSDLGLNRYLYRDNVNLDTTNALTSAYKDIGNEQGGSTGTYAGTVGSASNQQANAVASGSVIQSSLIQSSPGDNRVEINPNDSFRAFRNGNIVVLITQAGIIADHAEIRNIEIETATIETADIDDANIDVENVNDSTIDELDVTGHMQYSGFPMPQPFLGVVSSAGAGVLLPTGWSAVRNSTGDYTVTHNLNNGSYVVTVTPLTGHFRCQVSAQTLTTFDVTWQESDYSAGLYVGEVPVDVGFGFHLLNILP